MISIFAKRAFLNTDPHQPFKMENYHGRGHLMRVSSIIRGDQISEELGAKYNPTDGYEDDVCIYVKPHLKKDNMTFKFEGRKSYVDIIDGHNLGQALRKYPEVGCITCSKEDKRTMKRVLSNKVLYIPQHHCNFKNVKRNAKEIKKVGVIGTESSFQHLPKDLEKELGKRNIELIKFSKFFEHRDIVNFYMSIDLQIVWRPYRKVLSNPLKIVNAASFGIPTIALDEPAFKEVDGCYLIVDNNSFAFSGLLYELDYLIKNFDTVYKTRSNHCLEQAKYYHIKKVAKMYRRLDVWH